jgi:hypothetical protein
MEINLKLQKLQRGKIVWVRYQAIAVHCVTLRKKQVAAD